jgi:hypothetical protein
MKLYQIPQALRALEEQIEEAEGVLTPEMEAELDALGEQFDKKAEYIAMLIREAKLQAEAWKAEEERVSTRRRTLERRAEHLTRYVHQAMTAAGVTKIKGELLSLGIQRNGQPSVSYEGDPSTLPPTFQRVRIEMDGTRVREAIKAGEELPEGVQVHHGTHLRIR